jgi:hypothetical protein
MVSSIFHHVMMDTIEDTLRVHRRRLEVINESVRSEEEPMGSSSMIYSRYYNNYFLTFFILLASLTKSSL